MRISDWSSDVCSSDLLQARRGRTAIGAQPVVVQLQTDTVIAARRDRPATHDGIPRLFVAQHLVPQRGSALHCIELNELKSRFGTNVSLTTSPRTAPSFKENRSETGRESGCKSGKI